MQGRRLSGLVGPCPHGGRDARGDGCGILVLPESEDQPAGGLEHSGVVEVAVHVTGDFRPPVGGVGNLRALSVVGAAMPKTAVAENRDALTSKDHVGPNRPVLPHSNRKVDPKT